MSELGSMVPAKDGGADSQAQFSCIPSYKNELQKSENFNYEATIH